MQVNHKLTLTVLASLALLGACNRNDDGRTVGQQVDQTVAKVEQKSEEAKDATAQAADRVGDKAKDLSITASINAELARDEKLSALSINVDTVGGRVTLRGTAPDGDARSRASTLAHAVTGVVSVDNQLSVSPPRS